MILAGVALTSAIVASSREIKPKDKKPNVIHGVRIDDQNIVDIVDEEAFYLFEKEMMKKQDGQDPMVVANKIFQTVAPGKNLPPNLSESFYLFNLYFSIYRHVVYNHLNKDPLRRGPAFFASKSAAEVAQWIEKNQEKFKDFKVESVLEQ